MGMVIIAFGVIICLTSVLGCFTAKYKNPCFAIPFGLMAFIFGLVLLIVGAISAGAPAAMKLGLTGNVEVCPNGSSKFDDSYQDMVGKVICSELCPCDGDKLNTWLADKNDTYLRGFGRTLKYSPDNAG
jgi:hypothetical protein